ncbi:MAG: S8 family serine peptidase [Chitinophagales bacterium]|nr:S8 family serine peptidase [Chitinophagales bacterium]MCZ2392773.1 S8 family serine peptidase [Chitinophagales bacterium]
MAKNKGFFLFLFLFIFINVHAEIIPTHSYVLVFFKDKKEIPEAQLKLLFSSASLARRERQGISFDEVDYPVHQAYIQKISSKGFVVEDYSKWLNAVLLRKPFFKKRDIKELCSLDFVDNVEYLGGQSQLEGYRTSNHQVLSHYEEVSTLAHSYYRKMGLDTLHAMGYWGKNIHIGIIDGGFWGVNSLKDFQHLYQNGQIDEVQDFTHSNEYIYSVSSHGTKILSLFSTMNGNKLQGAAPLSTFSLLKSEWISHEIPLEEFFFVKAVEYCDSIGVDVINASIGYNYFEDIRDNYSRNSLYSHKSISSRVASLAASRGMIFVTSAGNEGNQPWKEVTFPADADSILAVGALDFKEQAVVYASYGRANSPLVRPNVAAFGDKVYTINEEGNYVLSYGSSYAAPWVTAAVACLWEMYPNLKAIELIKLLECTSKDADKPQLQSGFGIPDLKKAINLLEGKIQF